MKKTATILAALLAVSLNACATVDVKTLPEAKRTELNLYVTAAEVPALKKEKGAVFIDIRSPEEVAFLGMASDVDFHVPYKFNLASHELKFNEKKSTYDMKSNPNFITEIESALMKADKIGEDTPIILMCRSGDRSSAAVGALQKYGYKNIYTVVDGYEGDLSKEGARTVNGWKNSNLPWSYKLDKNKIYFQK